MNKGKRGEISAVSRKKAQGSFSFVLSAFVVQLGKLFAATKRGAQKAKKRHIRAPAFNCCLFVCMYIYKNFSF